jgi:hypothetical protein
VIEQNQNQDQDQEKEKSDNVINGKSNVKNKIEESSPYAKFKA